MPASSPAGTTLPPQRELADFLDLNPSTVARAYALARERGLVYGVTGKGTFVAPHAQSDLTITAEGAGGLVELLGMVTGFNQCDGLVADAVRAVAQRGYLSRLMDYSNPCGFPHHLEAGRRWLAWKGLRREPDCVVVTSGVQQRARGDPMRAVPRGRPHRRGRVHVRELHRAGSRSWASSSFPSPEMRTACATPRSTRSAVPWT